LQLETLEFGDETRSDRRAREGNWMRRDECASPRRLRCLN